MTWLWRIPPTTALLMAALACGGGPELAPAGQPDQAAQAAATGRSSSEIVGTLAPGIAPPSTLVVLEALDGLEVPVATETALMDQAGTEFIPGFLVAQAGQNVLFRNSEDVLHNIRVTEAAEQKPLFNVATPPFGKYEYRFERPGLYNVGCDIHTTMRADILIIATPYRATTGADGGFAIAGVLPGRYNLIVYAGAAPVVRSIEVKEGRTDLGVIQ